MTPKPDHILKNLYRKRCVVADLTVVAVPPLARFSICLRRSPRSAQYGCVTHYALCCHVWHGWLSDTRFRLVQRHRLLKRRPRRLAVSEKAVFLSLNVEERDTSGSWRLIFDAPLRRTHFFFGLIVFLTGYHLLNLLFSFFCFAVYYMWILIRDHGRLRVPRQAKFLSCKYSIYWLLIMTPRTFTNEAC